MTTISIHCPKINVKRMRAHMAKLEYERINLATIADHLEKAKRVDSNGNVSFDGFAHCEATAVLFLCLKFSSHIPDRERQRIINGAVAAAAQRGTITKQSLEREIGATRAALPGQAVDPVRGRYNLVAALLAVEPAARREDRWLHDHFFADAAAAV